MRHVVTIALALAVIVLSVTLDLAGCATAASGGGGVSLHAKDFVALAVGNSWEYKVTPSAPDAQNGEVKIVDKDAQGFFVDNHGGKMAPRTDGVFDGERFLIQEPIEEGHEWIAVPKDQPSVVERYKITSIGASAHVPAGNFEGCVEVEASQDVPNPKTGEKAVMKMTWTYAPGVGLVRAVQLVTPEKSPAMTTMTMELVKFHVDGVVKPAS